jgi:hypothetical protein
MNAFDQLFIRACKSKNPFVRLQSLRRRFYCASNDSDHEFHEWVCVIGVEVLKRTIGFSPIDFRDHERNNSAVLAMEFQPEKFEGWSYGKRRSYVQSHAIRLIFCHTSKEELLKIGYVSPACFRIQEKSKWRLTTRYEYVGY